jgi:hypothetical protein
MKGRGPKFLLSTPTFILPHRRGRRLSEVIPNMFGLNLIYGVMINIVK